jgi:signal transduction histidine kinase
MRTIRAKIILAFLAVIVVCLVPTSLAAGYVIRHYQQRDALERLSSLGQTVAGAMLGRPFAQSTPEEIIGFFNEQRNTDVLLVITDGRGVVQADSAGKYTGQQWVVPDTRGDARGTFFRPSYKGELSAPDGQRFAVAAFRFDRRLRPNGQQTGTAAPAPTDPATNAQVIIVALPWSTVNNVWGVIGTRLRALVLIAFVIAIGTAFLLTRSITSRLRTLTEGAHAMARGDYDRALLLARVDDSKDEVGELAAAFQTMATNVSRAQRAERDLVANVSHELKTPLTSIQGFSQAMLDGTVTDAQEYQELALIVQQEAQRMRRLVDQMLELSRLESGTSPLDLGPVHVDEFIENIGKRYTRLGEAKGVAVQWGAPSGLILSADAGRLEQVLVNLLDNALQYTDSGGTIALYAQHAQPGGVSFVVRDTGKGIPAADVPRLFERFYQVERSRSGQGRHVGLGLAIVREIVDAHRGRIHVESTVGVGTTVTVTIPQSVHGRGAPEPGRQGEGYNLGSRVPAPSR